MLQAESAERSFQDPTPRIAVSARRLKDARSDLVMEILDEGDELGEILDGHSSHEMLPILRKLRLCNGAEAVAEAVVELRDYLNKVVGEQVDKDEVEDARISDRAVSDLLA